MNQDAVIAALNTVIKGDLYRGLQEKYRDLSPDRAKIMVGHDLAPQIAEVLARQPEYRALPKMMVRHDRGGTGLQQTSAAHLLIIRAINQGCEKAASWIGKVLAKTRANGMRVMPLWGLTIEAAMTLAPDLVLMPFSELPPSPGRAWVEHPSERFAGGASVLSGPAAFTQPTAAIVARIVIEPVLVDEAEWLRLPDHDAFRLSSLLNEARLCLSVIGPSPVLGPIEWFQFDDPDLDEASPGGVEGNHLEIFPTFLPLGHGLDLKAAQTLISLFLALTGTTRERVRIALQRLFQALLRRGPGDKSADLSIALETLLMDERGENRWKVSTRAAVLTGSDLHSKLYARSVIAATYDMRSALVHSGAAGSKYSVYKQGKRPAAEVCEKAVPLCAAVIRTIIEHGGIPSWPEFDVSGGTAGWPKPITG